MSEPSGPGTSLSLPEGEEVHVWAVSLNQPPEKVGALEALLAQDELDRAYRFRFDRHRRRFIVGRGVLRSILGSYLGVEPRSLSFSYGDKGKPALAVGWSEDLSFNLSHSSELALYGFGRRLELGIDVEHLRELPGAQDIAERFFSVPERLALRGVSAESQSDAFFNCWTRKEAYIKATGDGLSMALDSFDVTLVPGEPARMLCADGDTRAAARWSMVHLEPAPGYVGALAAPSPRVRVVSRDWTV